MSVDKSSDRVREMFGQIAPRYDLLNHLLSMNVDRRWRRRTVATVPPVGGEPILDVCTGTGDLALAYARATCGDVPIVGVDFCRPMLDVARRKQPRRRWAAAVEWVEADAEQLPLDDDRFQIVAVAFGLRNVADTDRGLAEMVRVCRPGGRVAVLEFSMPRTQPLKGVYTWYFRRVLPRIGQGVARNRHDAYRYLPESVGQFPSGDELLARMTAAGLTRLESHPMTFGIATLYVGTK